MGADETQILQRRDSQKLEHSAAFRYETAMKKFSLCCALLVLLLGGCARNYVITLNNGTQLGAKGKPKLENGSYVFKDARGQDSAIAAGRVSLIEPAREAEKQQKSGFINSK